MQLLPSCFKEFLQEIRPTESQKKDYQQGHKTLRDRLTNYEELKPVIVTTFLQGSYRRYTAVRPKGDLRPDVDVIVVTKLDKDNYKNPNKAMDLFIPFLEEYYKGKYKKQGRSFGIELSYVDLDLVITSAPSEKDEEILKSASVNTIYFSEDETDWRLVKSWIPREERGDKKELIEKEIREETEWKTEPLWIPNRDTKEWERTHPLEQIKWTRGKNARCNFHYINVVKAIKWWQKLNYEDDRPKGYPLEHLIGHCCPDDINSIAEGITLTLEKIVKEFYDLYIVESKPFLNDHGVPEHDVFTRISEEEFQKFYYHINLAAKTAREALDSDNSIEAATKWRKLFDKKFPIPSKDYKSDNENFDSKGPFSVKSQTGDLTPRKYGYTK
ncbi:MAG: nucleotidyltransferase [Candidatus Eremiobacterota bacterium]